MTQNWQTGDFLISHADSLCRVFIIQTGGPVGLRSRLGLVCKYYESVVFVSLSSLCNSTQTEVNSENIQFLS